MIKKDFIKLLKYLIKISENLKYDIDVSDPLEINKFLLRSEDDLRKNWYRTFNLQTKIKTKNKYSIKHTIKILSKLNCNIYQPWKSRNFHICVRKNDVGKLKIILKLLEQR